MGISFDAAAPRRNCARVAFVQTREVCCRSLRVIIWAILAALATPSTPATLRKVGRFAAGARIHDVTDRHVSGNAPER
jgi:hypothetical protein